MMNKSETVEKLCDYIRRNASSEMSLSSLGKHFKLSPFTIQKMFKEIMGISPRKYIEECRIVLLKKHLKNGEPIPAAIYKSGYNSQSWLYVDSTSKLGMTPSCYRKGGEGVHILYMTAKCRLGRLLVAETEHGICAVSIADGEQQLISTLRNEYPKAEVTRSEKVRDRLNAVLDYFDGQLLNLPVDIGGTDFQRRVWAALLTIPYGETRTYSDVAEMIGMPLAHRAVANACAANPVPLIVPCHRVVRKDGQIGGYALGPERKSYLLEHERDRRSPG